MPMDVDQLDRAALELWQLTGTLEQLTAGALSVDPVRKIIEVVLTEDDLR
jgi:hypothetical protein